MLRILAGARGQGAEEEASEGGASLLAPTMIKYESLLQKLVKSGLEWIEPLQAELAEEAVAVRQEMKLMKGVLKCHQMSGLPVEQTLPGSKPFTTTHLEFMDIAMTRRNSTLELETTSATFLTCGGSGGRIRDSPVSSLIV